MDNYVTPSCWDWYPGQSPWRDKKFPYAWHGGEFVVYEWHASVNALSREAKTRLMCPTDMESDQEMLAKILGVEYAPMVVDFGRTWTWTQLLAG